MRYAINTVAILAVSVGLAVAEDSRYVIRISGTVASRLPSDTSVIFWHPMSGVNPHVPPGRRFHVSELPVSLKATDFTGHMWYVDFRNSKDQVLFSMRLSEDLFDKPRTINILLNQPKVKLDASYLPGSVRYIARTSQRMQYRELPNWDRQSESFRIAVPPIIRITDLQSGVSYPSVIMGPSCGDDKWWGDIDPHRDIPNNHRLRLTVVHDSGGLYEKVTATTIVPSLWP